ncbi:adenylyltransferase and sulfurtransferase MOCS3 isoform X2 [Capsicum chacoense]
MINDCCVVLGRLTVYNYNGGLCYRCLFPTPLPTVKHILSKGNPHLVYGARVLVKPYREKSKLESSRRKLIKLPILIHLSLLVYENARLLKIEFEKRRFLEFQHYQMRVGYSVEDLKFSSEGHNEQLEFLSDEDFSDMKDV